MPRGLIIKRATVFLWLTIAATLFCVLFSARTTQAAINQQINFQGKLTNTDGTNVANGTYSIVFSIYTASSGGTAVWTETQSGVSITDGVFQVALGSVTALPGSVDFNNSSLYLGIKVGSDPEMTPRVRFTATPYSFNSNALNGIASTGFVQLGQAATAQTDGSTNPSIFINKTGGSGNLLQLQSAGVDMFKVDNAGAVTVASNLSQTSGLTLFQNSAYTSNAFVINNGVSNATPTIPNSYAPTQVIRVSQSTGSRPLFFGYDNGSGTGWASYMTAGACGSFNQMCLDLGSGTTNYTALENVGTTLNIGGGDDGNFTNIAFKNSGTTSFVAAAPPTADQVTISNAGQPITTGGVDNFSVNFVGGAAAVEASGMRVDFTPGSTSGGTWSGMRIVANATGPATGVTAYGLKLEGPTVAGAGQATAIKVASGWDLGIDIQSGGMQLAAQSDPAAPATGNLKIYAKDIAGRVMPKWTDPAGQDTQFQASLGFNRVALVLPNGASGGTCAANTQYNSIATTPVTVGTTCASPAPASTNLLTSVRRTTSATGAVAGTINSQRQTTLMAWRGNASGLGGFFYTTRFGTSALSTNERAFVGLSSLNAAPTNIDPTTSNTYDKLGMGINAGSGNWKIINNVSGTTPAAVDLGTNFPVNTTALYELVLYSPPNGSSIGWRVTNLSTNNQASGTFSSNIPANTTFLAPLMWHTNNTNATIATMDFIGWYLETVN